MHYSGSSVGTGFVHFLNADARGSIIYEANRFDGNRQVNAYDPFGVPDQDNGGRFGYTGQAYVPEIGMFYYKARMYSPTLGRFMQTDPIGYADGMNMYAYVGNDPVNAVDPTGLFGDDCTVTNHGYWVYNVNNPRQRAYVSKGVTIDCSPSLNPALGGGLGFAPQDGGGPANTPTSESAGDIIVTGTRSNARRPIVAAGLPTNTVGGDRLRTFLCSIGLCFGTPQDLTPTEGEDIDLTERSPATPEDPPRERPQDRQRGGQRPSNEPSRSPTRWRSPFRILPPLLIPEDMLRRYLDEQQCKFSGDCGSLEA